MDKLYLVTGVSSGIGFSVANRLLDAGHRVVGVSRSVSDKLKNLQEKYPDKIYFESRDLSQELDSLPKWVRELAKEHGKFSGYVHAAGVLQILPLRFNSEKKLLEIFSLNVFSALSISQGLIHKNANIGANTSIVFVSSIAANTGSTGLINYSATKAALNGAMRAMAKEVSSDGLRVNSILPGMVKTELLEKHADIYDDKYLEKMNSLYPLELGSVEDVTNLVEFLLSTKSKWITGSEMVVDGGITLGAHE